MHRFQPRIYLVVRPEGANHPITDIEQEKYRTYIFPETIFTAVTAYQNQLVSFERGWWVWGLDPENCNCQFFLPIYLCVFLHPLMYFDVPDIIELHSGDPSSNLALENSMQNVGKMLLSC